MSEWQPIETAPRDGTEILGWFPELNRCAEFTWWIEREEREYGKVVRRTAQWACPYRMIPYWGGKEKEPDPQPTHWMPIPKSPGL